MMLRVLLALLLFVSVGLAGCKKEQTPGEKVDQAIENTKDAADDMGDKAKDAAEEAGDAAEKATDNM